MCYVSNISWIMPSMSHIWWHVYLSHVVPLPQILTKETMSVLLLKVPNKSTFLRPAVLGNDWPFKIRPGFLQNNSKNNTKQRKLLLPDSCEPFHCFGHLFLSYENKLQWTQWANDQCSNHAVISVNYDESYIQVIIHRWKHHVCYSQSV